MKKTLSVVLCVLLSLTILLPTTVFAASDSQLDVDNIQKNISVMEADLEKSHTDVVAELDKMISEYSAIQQNSADVETAQKAEALVNALEELKSDYQEYNNPSSRSLARGNLGYAASISAVIAYFNSKGYTLAAELLTQMKKNTSTSNIYTPIHGSNVRESKIFKEISAGSSTSGSSAFPKSGNTNDLDLYYAIHGFSYTKQTPGSITVTILDYYDYSDENTHYTTIEGAAVDAMYKAQQAGYVVPYTVKIVATP